MTVNDDRYLLAAREAVQARVAELDQWRTYRPDFVAALIYFKEHAVRKAVRQGAPCTRVGGRDEMRFTPLQIVAVWEHLVGLAPEEARQEQGGVPTASPPPASRSMWGLPCSPADRMSVEGLLALRRS